MRISALLLFVLLFSGVLSFGQCPECGNGMVNAGETTVNCPEDVPHPSSCVSPCGQPTSFESAAGIRISHDFVGTTTYSTAGLPVGWSFAGAPSPTTAGALPVADAYGAKAGLVQPGCSGGCTGTNGFCIGNIGNTIPVGAGGAGGKLGANFDGRNNVASNPSYAVLRGQGNPTLISETFNFSAVEGFKVQFWLAASESSCGQTNGWGSCVGNAAFLDFSSNGGTSWTPIMQLTTSSSSTDMCLNNSTNTLWFREGAWSRVCLTVFKSSTSPGNFYSAATATTAASGIMVNSAYFTSNFKFRIRYAQTASCTSGITTTNPGRYLAIDYPVITSGDQLIPCGISFSKMCGFGEDSNDDGVGSSTSFTTNTAFSTVKRGVNFAEKGVEIFHAQNASYASLNATGTTFPSDFTLCNAEGGDAQCIDWRTNNNSYFVQYECVTDWEAPSNSINVNYFKGTSPSSFTLTKVTASGKTAAIGWRYSGSRFVNCSSSSDLNVGCNGYSFVSGSLPTQFARGFYQLAVNNLGQSWSFYGASSCSNYFNGPFIGSIAVPENIPTAPNFTLCSGSDLVFSGAVDYCSTSSGLTGTPGLTVSGPAGFSEFIASNSSGLVPITTPGDYILQASVGSTPAQCLDCGRATCITVTQAEIDACATALPVTLSMFDGKQVNQEIFLNWRTENEVNSAYFTISKINSNNDYEMIGTVVASGNSSNPILYQFTDKEPVAGINYYRLQLIDLNGSQKSQQIVSVQFQQLLSCIYSETQGIQVSGLSNESEFLLYDTQGASLLQGILDPKDPLIQITHLRKGVYYLKISGATKQQVILKVLVQ